MATISPDRPRDEAEARDRIEALLRDYVHCIDDARYDDWPDFFTEDCRYQIIGRDSLERGEFVGVYYCDSRAMLRDRILCMRETSIFEAHYHRHLISATRITGREGEAWKAETSIVVFRIMMSGETRTFCTGKYVDTIVFEDGKALFKEKLVVTDSSRYDTMIAIPV